jgi:peptide/nickel transport system substrate-binding protein
MGSMTGFARRAALAALVALGLGGPALAQQAPATLVVARNMDVNSLDPHRGFCDTCQIVFDALYDTLVTIGPDNRTPVPRLATRWEASSDLMRWTFHLDPRARFASGRAVEAADVAWSFRRLAATRASSSFLAGDIERIETPDARTVVVHLKAANSEFVGIAAAPYMAVVDRNVAEAAGIRAEGEVAQDGGDRWFGENSAGSGPFTLARYRPNDELRLARNANYWRDAPAFAEVVIRQAAGAAVQGQLLASGGADIALQLDTETARALPRDRATVQVLPSPNFIYLAIAPGAPAAQGRFTPEVREAISLAVDRAAMIEFVLGGAGKPQASPIPNGFPGSAGLEVPGTDLARARQMLAAAGHGRGFDVDFTFPAINSYGADMSLVAQRLQQDLGRVGIRLRLQPATFPVWVQQMRAAQLPMTIGYYAPDYFGSAQYVNFFGIMEGTPWFTRAGGGNLPAIANGELRGLLTRALAAPDAQREAAFNAVARSMMGDRIILPLLSPDLVIAHRPGLQGVRYSTCCNLPLAEIRPR